ncbi:hypothetical protein [Streptomyces sp. NPDC054961]
MTRTASAGGTVLRATGRIRDTAAHVVRLVEHKTPDPVRDRAVRTAAQVRGAASRAGRLAGHGNPRFGRAKSPWAAVRGRGGRRPAIAAAGVLATALLVRRVRRARHQK